MRTKEEIIKEILEVANKNPGPAFKGAVEAAKLEALIDIRDALIGVGELLGKKL